MAQTIGPKELALRAMREGSSSTPSRKVTAGPVKLNKAQLLKLGRKKRK